ncbi:MAG: nicotinate-nucleotide adenylyltransferase [Gemmatimonadota bacterium]|nr:nicotinate-nucleotide adenylyltransferase [Gemmatimonadota bacterium]
MRLGVLGGTFDPPHVGHLLAASDACEALSLDKLLFVPAKVPPYKARTVQASPHQRLRMLEMTIGDDPRFEASRLELDRDGLSFTVDTLQTLSESAPDTSLFMLIGDDLATQIASWRDAARLVELATIVVLARATTATPSALEATLPMMRLATRQIELSSTEIRDRVRVGRSIHGFVTDAVSAFIHAAGLYR